MRKLVRIAIAVAMLAAIAFVAPSPVSADHAQDCKPDLPAPPSDCDTTVGDRHEPQPDPRVVDPATATDPDDDCVVVGEIVPGAPGSVSYSHWTSPIVNNASHSHYTFVDTTIVCGAAPVEVNSDGGNDGHIVDTCVDGTPPSNGPQPRVPCTPPHPGSNGGPVGTNPGEHHGSTNDSGWSHSSFYDEAGAAVDPSGPHATCATATNVNKADIEAVDKGIGWVKYLRVGNVVLAWGCYEYAHSGGGTWKGTVFSTVLALAPPSVPAAVGGGGIVGSPTCILPDDIEDAAGQGRNDCGFTITGPAVRGTAFL